MWALAACSGKARLNIVSVVSRRFDLSILIADDEERDLQNDLVDYGKPRFSDGVL